MDYSEFIDQVMAQTDYDDRQQAIDVSRAVLGTLGEFLGQTQRRKFKSQLPGELREFVLAWKDTADASKDLAGFPIERFVTRVQARSNLNHHQAVSGILAVTNVLQQAVSHGELKEMADRLRAQYGTLLGTE